MSRLIYNVCVCVCVCVCVTCYLNIYISNMVEGRFIKEFLKKSFVTQKTALKSEIIDVLKYIKIEKSLNCNAI